MIAKLAFVVVAALLVVGCAASQTTSLIDNRTDTISTDASFLVAVKEDGTYAGTPHRESGRMARDAMVVALTNYAPNVAEIPSYVPEDTAIVSALEQNVDYLVYLKINHWEERATEWSGLPDRIEVETRLIDGRNGNVLEAQVVTAKSKWATLGGDHPEDLLVVPFDEFSRSMFGLPPVEDG